MGKTHEYAKNYRTRLRSDAVTRLGGTCKGCGFSDARALQIDHVNGGGVGELRTISWTKRLIAIIAGATERYQLLCANCNWIKRAENGESSGPKSGPRRKKEPIE